MISSCVMILRRKIVFVILTRNNCSYKTTWQKKRRTTYYFSTIKQYIDHQNRGKIRGTIHTLLIEETKVSSLLSFYIYQHSNYFLFYIFISTSSITTAIFKVKRRNWFTKREKKKLRTQEREKEAQNKTDIKTKRERCWLREKPTMSQVFYNTQYSYSKSMKE
jgi:hypothetical protein